MEHGTHSQKYITYTFIYYIQCFYIRIQLHSVTDHSHKIYSVYYLKLSHNLNVYNVRYMFRIKNNKNKL